MVEKPLTVVLCWHMHQPDYRDHLSLEFQLPWTYLHAVKDYTDMAAHLEAVPEARAVVNFSPVLLEQLEDYERQFSAHRRFGSPFRDPLLAALEAAVFPSDPVRRYALMAACLRANPAHMIDRYPGYVRLARIAQSIDHEGDGIEYLSDEFLGDIVTWYHLAWLGESVRISDRRVQQLIDRDSGFQLRDRRILLGVIGELIESLRGRYRRLAERGRVELSTSPYGHPMLPLLLDFNAARESEAAITLPGHRAYPGGAERAAWHVLEGVRVFEQFFGRRPVGCWPSEGGLSDATLDLLEQSGFAWTATGETVLRNSLRHAGGPHDTPGVIHSPWRRSGSGLNLFARDDALSDLIGFTYSDWHADDAVADLVRRLEQVPVHEDGDAVVSIIMDGENAWEHYPRNGHYFLSALYRRLCEHPRIRLSTYAELSRRVQPREVAGILAGSWVYGNFSTWMGDADKNRAWDMLVEAKQACDAALHGDGRDLPNLARQLAACEASDWFWWLGDYNPAAAVGEMERLFRMHVANLYQILRLEPPPPVSRTLSRGHGAPEMGGTMRRGSPAG